MSNRLKFYREQMAAFEGTVDPQRAIDSGYYVIEPKKSSTSLLTRVALRPAATHLFIGGIGSGKTTQLHVVKAQLDKIENLYAYYVDVSSYTDISKVTSGVLIAITGVILSKILINTDTQIEAYKKLIHRYAYGYSELRPNNSKMSSLTRLAVTENIVRHEGVLNPQEKTFELEEAIKGLNKEFSSQIGDIILLFDGLDRLDDIQKFEQIIKNDVAFISSSGIGIVLVGPLRLAYSEYRDIIESNVNYTSYQPCFDVENNSEDRYFFEEILTIRAKQGFIEPSAIQKLIDYSGGLLRDLINLTQSSIEEAYISDADNLTQVHVERAANSFGRSKLLGVSNEDFEVLNKVFKTENFIPRTDEEIRLLVTGRILEYQNLERRFAVHPAIQHLLQKSIC
jgi:hypothetical protein